MIIAVELVVKIIRILPEIIKIIPKISSTNDCES